MLTYFYPRPPRGGRLFNNGDKTVTRPISIHALREEGDTEDAVINNIKEISIHALREEGDLAAVQSLRENLISIHALREEGDACDLHRVRKPDISIHALREEGDARFARACACTVIISIHALREEGDRQTTTNGTDVSRFLSTPSARRATRWQMRQNTHRLNFYPRPPRGGRRLFQFYLHGCCYDFYPRPPRGGRPQLCKTQSKSYNFYPRPPRGGRQLRQAFQVQKYYISIHALREEGDCKNRDKISVFKQIIQHSARI